MCSSPRETLLREIRQKKSENDYMIMPENFNKTLEQKRGPLPPHPSPHPPQKNQIWILCQNSLTRELKIRVVRFVLKKLLTYFEILIVPHALQCVDGCFFCILPHLTFCFWHTEFRFKFFGKIHSLEAQYKSCRVCA